MSGFLCINYFFSGLYAALSISKIITGIFNHYSYFWNGLEKTPININF